MRSSWRYLMMVFLSCCAWQAARGNITPTHGYNTWDEATGFPGGYVYAISQTADGYIWIGTNKGLVRYDGLSFVAIRGSGETAPPVMGALADAQGQLWTTDDHTHLFRYEAGRLVGPLADNGKHQYMRGLLSRAQNGALLFASEMQGLVEYGNGTARTLLEASQMPRSPTDVVQTADGAFWIGTDQSGVFRLALTQAGPQIQHFNNLAKVKVNSLLAMGNATLLIGTDKGLLRLVDGKVTPVRAELSGFEILTLAHDSEGGVLIGSEGHVFKARKKDIDAQGNIREIDVLNVHGTVTALFEDRDGDLWVGGPEVIERYRSSGFTTYLGTDGLGCTNCGAIYVDRHNNTWFAPWEGGLFELSRGGVRAIEAQGLKEDTVYSISGGGDEVWVGRKNGGLTLLDLRGDAVKASTYTRKDGLAENSIYSVYRTADGTVWAGTRGAGLSRFRAGGWQTFSTKDGLPSNRITAIEGSATGEIFVGTPSGLGMLKNNRWETFTAENGMPPGPIESLFLDNAGTLWIGTTKGLAFLRAGKVHVPLGAPYELYGEILGIAESQDWLWITTRNHVVRVKRSAVLNQTFTESDYREFGSTEGLPSTEGTKRNRSVVVDERERIWFSLSKGISVLEANAFAKPAFPVAMRVDGMLLDGKAISSDRTVHVAAGRHRLALQYTGVNVSNPEAVRYRYRLDGVDPDWSGTTALREVDYTNVPPGQYRFHVMARNPDGVWNGQEATILFEVDPAYWQTRWFQVSSVLALVLLMYGIYQLRVRQLHRQFNAVLGERINERTRIARELHDTLLQSLHGVLFQFQAARNLLPKRTEEAMQAMDSAIDATEQTITESRGAIHDLRTEAVRNVDLEESLRTAARELTESHKADLAAPVFDLVVEGDRKRLSPVFQNEAYRIALEILRNSYQHARASRVEIEIRYDHHAFRLRIRDDGKGIDPRVMKEGGTSGHWGLRGIRERAQKIGAQMDFWSEVDAGTEVQLSVPAAIAYEESGSGSKRT